MIVALPAREGLDQDLVGTGHDRECRLQPEPVRDLVGEARPGGGLGQQMAHAVGEIGREREFAAVIGRHLGLGRMRARDDGVGLAQALEAQHLAGEDEGVAGRELLDEIFLDLAEHAAAHEHARRLERAAFQPREPHAQHRRFDDGADIEPVLLRDARMRDAPKPLWRCA